MQRSPVRPDSDAPSRLRTLVDSTAFRAGIIVLSAVIIFSAWAFADRVRDDSRGDRDIVLELEDDPFEEARAVAESGETSAAVVLLERILADEPSHERAAALLRRISGSQAGPAASGSIGSSGSGSANPGGRSDQDPAEDPGDDADSGVPESPAGSTSPLDDTAFLAPVADLRSLLPEVIAGWRRGIPVASDADATIPFEPLNPDAVSRVLYSVHDRGSEAGATSFVERTSKVAYASDGMSVRVGVVDAYFGTDGARLATISFARGRFAFEVVAIVPGGDPAAVRESAMGLARELEATR